MENKRTCGTCTECCQGWLWGESHGHNFYPGKPCHFVCETGCTIYNDRPHDPCKTFNCVWLIDTEFPEWMKPSLSKIIMRPLRWGDNNENFYLEVTECGQTISAKVLNWLFYYHLNRKLPMKIQIEGGWNYYGPKEFLKSQGII